MTVQRALATIKHVVAWLDLRDMFVFGGIGLAGCGMSLIFLPAGLIFAGLVLFWLGVRTS